MRKCFFTNRKYDVSSKMLVTPLWLRSPCCTHCGERSWSNRDVNPCCGVLQQTFRLTVRLRPWCIKLHLGYTWSQLEGPTDQSEKKYNFGKQLRFPVQKSSCSPNRYVFGIIGKLFEIVREWCLFHAAIFTFCAIQVSKISKYMFMSGHDPWIWKLTHHFPSWPTGPSSSLTIWSPEGL